MPEFELRKAELRELFTKMITALGQKDFDRFALFVTEQTVFEWPYVPLDDWDGVMVGGSAFRAAIEIGMAECDPYAYTIEAIHDLLDPDMLIAEYTSHSFFHPRKLPYSNKYVSVLRYEGDLVIYWKEYVNPLIIKQVYGDDFVNAAGRPGEPI